jgi:tRNA (guanine-N7-)-methyltransferase
MTGTEDTRVHRAVVSFVRRSPRMRANQRRAWDQLHQRYLIDVPRLDTSTSIHPEVSVDLATAFGRDAPLVVEIGPGTGESLIPMAQAHPDQNILAFEVYQPAIARMLAALSRESVENVRLVEADAVAGLRLIVSERSVDAVWTFFPDPWHKSRHRKRRLVDRDFADLVASRLKPGARWRLATDWEDYAGQIRGVLDIHPAFVNDHAGWAPRWDQRPLTRFEQRGIEGGRSIFDLDYRRAG